MRKYNLVKNSTALIWTISSFAFIFIIAFVLPRKGFDFTDHGYYLYDSYLMSKWIMPIEGIAYLFYAVFMKMGIWNYYLFELFYFLFLAVSIVVFWTSFRPLKESVTLPLAVLIGLSSNFTYMMSYQHAPITLLLLGFGLIFHAIEKNKHWLCVLGALALGYGATTNISLFPTIITTAVLVTVVCRRSTMNKTFHLIYWPIAFSFIALYMLNQISFFQLNSDPAFSVLALIRKIPHYIWFLISTNPFAVLFVCIMPFLRHARHHANPAKIIQFFLLILGLSLFWYLGHSWWQHTRHHGPQRDIINLGVFYSYFALMIYALFFRLDAFFLKMTLFMIATLSYMTILSIATLSDFSSHMCFIAPISVTVGCLVFEKYCDSIRLKHYFITIMTLFTMMSVFFFSHYTFRSYPLFEHKVFMTNPKMRGVMESDAKVTMINKITALYEENNCDKKWFVAYPSLPFLYFYFHRSAPLNQPWLSSTVGYITSEKLISMLKNHKQWCVVTAPGYGYQNSAKSYLSDVDQYLTAKSAKKMTINSTGDDTSGEKMPGKIVFYAQPG